MEVDYNIWWPLHIRAAKGETLSPAEAALLQTAYAEQNALEHEQFRPDRERHLQRLRELRDETASLKASINAAQKQRRLTGARIRRLAANLDAETREAIGMSSTP